MQSLIGLINTVIGLYIWCIIFYAIFSLLYNFQILNQHSQITYRIYDFLGQLIEPALRHLRRVIPMFGTIDLTPVVLILLLQFLQSLINEYAHKMLF